MMAQKKSSIIEPDATRAFIDIETTGFNPRVHEIIEFAGIKQDGLTGDVEILEMKVLPNHIETASEEALQLVGYSPVLWLDAVSPGDAIRRIVQFLRGCVLIGHNVQFDYRFLKKYAKQYKAGMLPMMTVDTQDLAKEFLKPRGLTKVGLASVCDFIGISNDGAHQALSDTIRCKEVFDHIYEGKYDTD